MGDDMPETITPTEAVALAKPSCKMCYGRGYEGYDPINRVYIMCRCVAKACAGKRLVQECQA